MLLLSCSKGMLRRWDDSQKYLSDNPHLVCEETANYLVIWCIDLEVEEVSVADAVSLEAAIEKAGSYPSAMIRLGGHCGC